MNYVFLETTDSTLSYAAQHQDDLPHMTMITAHEQLAGRGQRGNSWESEPGKNLTVALFCRPEEDKVPARDMASRQFAISEATALGVADTLALYGIEASLKWPNDIYVGDRKICGILIEHTLLGGRIGNSRIGIGINANQQRFLSDAPNPVSIRGVLGHDVELPMLLEQLSTCMESRLEQARREPEALHDEYLAHLWRADGKAHPFRLRQPGALPFMARIITVRPEGWLVLADSADVHTEYTFKEVEFMLAEAPDTAAQ